VLEKIILLVQNRYIIYLFSASTNPSSAELNFPSTPVPLLGFHG